MKLTVSQKNLKKALSVVEKIVSKNTTLPILNNILIKTENGRLKIAATNLEIGINYFDKTILLKNLSHHTYYQSYHEQHFLIFHIRNLLFDRPQSVYLKVQNNIYHIFLIYIVDNHT